MSSQQHALQAQPGRLSAAPPIVTDPFERLTQADPESLVDAVVDGLLGAIASQVPGCIPSQLETDEAFSDLIARKAVDIVDWLQGGPARLLQRFNAEFAPIYPGGPDGVRRARMHEVSLLFVEACQNEPDFPYESMADQIIERLKLWVKSKEWRKDNGQFVPEVTNFFVKQRYRTLPDGMDDLTPRSKPNPATKFVFKPVEKKQTRIEAIRHRLWWLNARLEDNVNPVPPYRRSAMLAEIADLNAERAKIEQGKSNANSQG
jgi:hypothetical protein